MSWLAEFLLARIAEDLAVAKRTAERMEHVPPAGLGGVGNLGIVGYPLARVLAECEAKRMILDEATEVARHERTVAGMAGVVASAPTSGETIIRLLALPYADHPDYREEWKP